MSLFTDSDDIVFGSSTPTPSPRVEKIPLREKEISPPRPLQSETQTRKESRPQPTTLTPTLPRDEHRGVQTRPMNGAPRSSQSSLTAMMNGMKSSFLPPDMTALIRLILLSDTALRDPCLLMRSTESSLLVGTGFATITHGGHSYTSFPDMRLAYSERSRLAAWILPTDDIDLTPILSIAETLDYPPLLMSQELMTRFRSSFADDTRLSRCRLLDIHDRLTSRDLTISMDEMGRLLYQTNTLTMIDTRKAFVGSLDLTTVIGASIELSSRDGALVLRTSDEKYIPIQTGSIMECTPENISTHTLRYTLDRCYLDARIVGLVSGYTLADRVEMAEHGLVTFVLEEDHAHRVILSHIFIDSRGFVPSHEMMRVHKELIRTIRSTYESTILSQPTIDRSSLVGIFRREVRQSCLTLTGKSPIILPIIQER